MISYKDREMFMFEQHTVVNTVNTITSNIGKTI